MNNRLEATVCGRVQGVSFRHVTNRRAHPLKLTGWVANRPDGSVRVVAEGAPDALAVFAEWLHEGAPAARVDRVELHWLDAVDEFTRFEIGGERDGTGKRATMRMLRILCGAVLLGLGGMLVLAGCRPVQPAGRDTAAGVVATGDSVHLSESDGMLVVDITSVRGIGRALVTLNPTAPPSAILLRLHLQGLEQLTVDNGEQRLEIAVASSPPHGVTQSAVGGEGTQLLHEGDALWATVTLTAGDGRAPAIPLQDGSIDVRLPAGLVNAKHSELALAWVDFYR